MMVAGRQTMMGPQGGALPYDYVCQFHTFDGYSVVITDSVPDSTKKWRVVFDGTYVSGYEANVLGLWDNTTGTAQRVYIGPYPNGGKDRVLLVATDYGISGASTNVKCELTCDIPNRLATRVKNGATNTSTIGNFGTFTIQSKIGLGARVNRSSSETTISVGFKGKVYSFEEWTSGVKTADWIPVVVGTEACYYDQITGTIYHADLTLGNALTIGPAGSYQQGG